MKYIYSNSSIIYIYIYKYIALHLAYEAGYQEIVQILESKGKASKSIANKEKKLPSQMRRN